MDRKHNKGIVPVARALRKNMTREERHLWYDFLRNYPVRFSRQKVLGKYIADFYCAKAKLVVELKMAGVKRMQCARHFWKSTVYLWCAFQTMRSIKTFLVYVSILIIW